MVVKIFNNYFNIFKGDGDALYAPGMAKIGGKIKTAVSCETAVLFI